MTELELTKNKKLTTFKYDDSTVYYINSSGELKMIGLFPRDLPLSNKPLVENTIGIMFDSFCLGCLDAISERM